MNNMFFNHYSSRYRQQSFFDFENTIRQNFIFNAPRIEEVPYEYVEPGFTESKIKELAEKISDELMVMVREQLNK